MRYTISDKEELTMSRQTKQHSQQFKQDAVKYVLEHPDLTNEECAKAQDMGNFYRVPADNRDLNYDKYFKEGDTKREVLTEFNSNNTKLLNVEETKEKIASLEYIQNELNGIPNIVK